MKLLGPLDITADQGLAEENLLLEQALRNTVTHCRKIIYFIQSNMAIMQPVIKRPYGTATKLL